MVWRFAELTVSIDDVDDAGRDAGFVEQARKSKRSERRNLGGLQEMRQ
jgi:hypothetical protein